ncbi:MAG: DUF4832 domain-containing protein [Clostridiales bacterium]|nr:DUF4832 domain-containing protein [Clostridiales bacterium]
MKKRICAVLSVAMLLTMTNIVFGLGAADTLVDQVDAGVIESYTESTETINQPDAGYSSGVWMAMKPGQVVSYNPTTFSVLFVMMGYYSDGYRSQVGLSNETLPLDESFFEGLEKTLQNAKQNGVMVGLRFRYDDAGKKNPEPATWEQLMGHLKQIHDSGLLEKYKDVLSYVETGTVGAWGEQHSGRYTTNAYVAKLTDAYLDMVPDSIQVSVRKPAYFLAWLQLVTGKNITKLKMYNDGQVALTAEQQAKADRVGLYNDGYMGSDSDLGTFLGLGESTTAANRQEGLRWLFGNHRAAYGGEYSGDYKLTLQYPTWQPINAIPEMYYSHVWNINRNVYVNKNETELFDTLEEAEAKKAEVEGWYTKGGLSASDAAAQIVQQDGKYQLTYQFIGYDYYTFTEELAKAANEKIGGNADLSAYYGQNCYKFIRDHIGYRLVVRDSKMTGGTVQPGETVFMKLAIENTGFSNIIKEKQVEILLVNGNRVYSIEADDIDPRTWLSGQTANVQKTITLPENISGGTWQVYMRITPYNDLAGDDAKCGSIFANDGIFDNALGGNLIGSITVDAPAEEQGGFVDVRPAGLYYDKPTTYAADADNIQFVDRNYVFKNSGLYGFTIMFKVDGIAPGSEINLTRWSTNGTSVSGFQTHSFNYFFKNNATYGYGLTIKENGYYLLYCPFYSVGAYSKASEAGKTNVSSFKINDTSTQREDKNTLTSLNGNEATITPLGIIEGAVTSYDITFGQDGGSRYRGTYAFNNTDKSVTENVQLRKAKSVLELYTGTDPSSYTENEIAYDFKGWTTQENFEAGVVGEQQIAVGTMKLSAYYQVNLANSALNAYTATLTDGKDEHGVVYTLDPVTQTAVVGNGSSWANNAGFTGAKADAYIIPAYVIADGKYYDVVGIGENAFRSNQALKKLYIPSTVQTFAENGLGGLSGATTLYCYQESETENFAQENSFVYEVPSSRTVYAAAFKDGDGRTLDVKSVQSGQVVSYAGQTPGKTVASADATTVCQYRFTDWMPTLTTTVTKDTIFRAQFFTELHDMSWEIIKPATETTAGEKKGVCSQCGYETTVVIEPLKVGDANGDGFVNVADVIIFRRYLAQGAQEGTWDLTGYNLNALDVNNDGKLTQADLTLLTRYVQGWSGIILK